MTVIYATNVGEVPFIGIFWETQMLNVYLYIDIFI